MKDKIKENIIEKHTNEDWYKIIASSHINPKLQKGSKYKNKYEQTKLRVKKLRNTFGF